MVEQGGNNPGGTGDAAGLLNTALPLAIVKSCGPHKFPKTRREAAHQEGGMYQRMSAHSLERTRGRQKTLRPNANGTTSSSRNCSSALPQRSVLDGEKIQLPKFVYDVKALRDNARIIVQRGALLRKADFRSPSSKLKLLGRPGSDHPIAACRRAELQAGGRAMLTGGLGTRAATSTASEVTMAELSAPAGLVDAHAVRRSWLLKGQNSLDNTGHHNRSFIVLLHTHPALGD
ncbi:BQ5605_C003g02063 [Microbotryum silenes-dioicae]|uniref:BQ5605_C003g02063 protein n=1 Tax=Microbotryum silenes-dioicae TaxID=796604 RepID=A0A2X0M4N3_9BASI|nr:BQ5605_C003g02063 [Microbotryum silenes-dioicae]